MIKFLKTYEKNYRKYKHISVAHLVFLDKDKENWLTRLFSGYELFGYLLSSSVILNS